MSVLGHLETFPALSRMSAIGGEPDVIGPKADIDTGMSGPGAKAEVLTYPQERPGLARNGHSLLLQRDIDLTVIHR